jgi:transposase
MNQKRQRKDFTDEFKKDAVRLVTEQGYSCNEVGRRLGINHSNVSRWVREYQKGLDTPQGPGSAQELEQEVKRLRKENKRLLMEREILKKAAAFFANESN